MKSLAMLSFSWSHHSGNKVVLELASLWPETHMGENAGEGAERAEPATTGNRQKGCKDLESDVG